MKAHVEPLLTIADLGATPDDGNRYELIEGELHVSTAPGYLHQTVLLNIATVVRDFLRENPIGEIVPGLGVIFDEFSGVIPDLVFYQRAQGAPARRGRLTAAPDIAIEILSLGSSNERRDRFVKLQLYSVRGVGEHRILDPQARTVEIYRQRKEGGLFLTATLRAGADLTSPILNGFRVAVQTLFA